MKNENNKTNDNGALYHYTDMNALVNIVRRENIILRATNCLFLNDSNEIIEGAKAVKRILDKDIHPAAFRGYYLTSFSNVCDKLNMWNMYAANGNGCAIGIDGGLLCKSYQIMLRCIYGEKEIDQQFKNFYSLNKYGCISSLGGGPEAQKMIDAMADKIREDSIHNQIITTCLGAKNIAYKEEDEIRFVVHVNDEQEKYVMHRTKNGIIIPYVEIILPKEALKSIVIGPTNNSTLALHSVGMFLNSRGYNLEKIDVYRSNIPYRG